MNTMKNPFLTLLFFLLISGLNAQESEKDYSEAFTLIEVWLDAQKDFDNLPGLSAIVVEDQEVLWSGAVGMANKEEQLAAQASTLCSICSISKLFTSVAIMTLYDEGKLRLDDRVGDLLPAYKLEQKFPDSGPITIRSLMTHSSGLPREAAYPYWTGPDFPFPTQAQIDAALSDQETLYPASTYFQYSNLAMTLLGEIVEELSGMSYEDYVRQRILEPLDLSDTRPDMPKELYGSELAIGYSAVDRQGDRAKVNFFKANGITPAAGFSSNVHDLGAFASWQFRLRDTTTTEILKPSTLKHMQQVHWTDPDWSTTWGLGFVVYKGPNGTTWVGHGGSCPGYRSSLQLDLANKRAYSVMINASGANPGKYLRGMHSILNKVKASAKKESDKDGAEQPDLSDYVGYYTAQPWWSEEYIGTSNGQLVVLGLPTDNPADAMTMLQHVEGDIFQRLRDDGEPGETVTFQRNDQGRVVSYEQHGNYTRKMER